jgi:hypothetical protein
MRARVLFIVIAILAFACAKEDVPTAVKIEAHKKTKPDIAPQAPEVQECNAKKVQTGPGCDMEGTIQIVRKQLEPQGLLAGCYRDHESGKRAGKITIKLMLSPDGHGDKVTLVSDLIGNEALVQCMIEQLKGLQFPPPGDVPCTIIYPFNFVMGS